MSYWFDGFNQISKTPPFQNVSVTASEPTNELFTLATIKNYLKVDVSTDDDLITLIQKSVRKQIENEIGGVQIVRRSVTQKQTGGIEKIELLRGPVNSITSITYYESFDSAGEVIDSAKYRQVNGMLYHETGFWNQGREGDGYVIVFDAGIVADTSNAAEAATPALRMAALRLIAYLYENREEFATTISEGGFSILYNTIVGNSELKNLLMAYAKARAVF